MAIKVKILSKKLSEKYKGLSQPLKIALLETAYVD